MPRCKDIFIQKVDNFFLSSVQSNELISIVAFIRHASIKPIPLEINLFSNVYAPAFSNKSLISFFGTN